MGDLFQALVGNDDASWSTYQWILLLRVKPPELL